MPMTEQKAVKCEHCECDVSKNDERLMLCPSCNERVCLNCWTGWACTWCDDCEEDTDG